MARKQSKASLGRIGRVEREQRINKIIRISLIVLLTVVSALVIGGLIFNYFITPAKVIATVFDQEILVRDFQTRVRMQRQNMVTEYNGYYQQMTLIQDPNTQQQIQQLLLQYEYQLDPPELIGQSIINQMIDDIVITREAQARGIEVDEAEITETLQSVFGYFPNPTETPELVKPAEGEEPVPTSIPYPEPTSVTAEEYDQALNEYLEAYAEFGVDEPIITRIIEAQLYRTKLTELLSEGISKDEDQVWARHILVDDMETAESILVRLEEGETFISLVQELSGDPSAQGNLGDLGWFGEGKMVQPFNDAAFAAEVGEIVGPVESEFGYHIIEIMGREIRPMAESDFQNLVNLALVDLLSEIKVEAEEAGDLVLSEDWINYTPDDPKPIFSMREALEQSQQQGLPLPQ
jgi:parvulin-like peptidyl-prolyl isomerase